MKGLEGKTFLLWDQTNFVRNILRLAKEVERLGQALFLFHFLFVSVSVFAL